MTTLPPDQLFLVHLAHIERVAEHFARKAGFSREETQDFVSHVRLKLIEDDYAVFRKFQGKSTMETYLTVVVRRHFQDHLNHRWGKWRPSAEAVRLGPLAIQLDTMLHRDRLSLHEACEILLANHHVKASRKELEELAERLPPHMSRGPENDAPLEDGPAKELNPAQEALAREKKARRLKILEFLKEALEQLPPEDTLLVNMSARFKVSQIARTLGLEQKPLYRRLEKILKALREKLESRGVRADEIDKILGAPEVDDESEE